MVEEVDVGREPLDAHYPRTYAVAGLEEYLVMIK